MNGLCEKPFLHLFVLKFELLALLSVRLLGLRRGSHVYGKTVLPNFVWTNVYLRNLNRA